MNVEDTEMGIDAEILIRGVPRATVSDDWLKRKSWDLCRAIGAKKFFISDGLPPADYEVASKAWHKAFREHPLAKDWDAGKKEVHASILADIGECPKEMRVAIEPTGSRYREEGDAEPGQVYNQDGDDVVAEAGECLLKLNLWGRYYGPGYERGDILTYCAIAEWLEINIEECEVWYGGDSSGVEAKPFGEDERRKMREHLYSKNGRDYFEKGWGFGREHAEPPACGLCPSGVYQGVQYGFGGAYAAFSCAGCGKSVESRDGGKCWVEKKED